MEDKIETYNKHVFGIDNAYMPYWNNMKHVYEQNQHFVKTMQEDLGYDKGEIKVAHGKYLLYFDGKCCAAVDTEEHCSKIITKNDVQTFLEHTEYNTPAVNAFRNRFFQRQQIRDLAHELKNCLTSDNKNMLGNSMKPSLSLPTPKPKWAR